MTSLKDRLSNVMLRHRFQNTIFICRYIRLRRQELMQHFTLSRIRGSFSVDLRVFIASPDLTNALLDLSCEQITNFVVEIVLEAELSCKESRTIVTVNDNIVLLTFPQVNYYAQKLICCWALIKHGRCSNKVLLGR